MINIYLLPLITIRTPRQLDALSTQTYVLAAVAAVVALFLAALVSSAIKFEGGARPSDPGKRKVAFWGFVIICIVALFAYNLFVVSRGISPNLQSRFMKTNVISLAIAAGVYLVAGFLVSKMFAKGKLGSWFAAR